MVEATSVVGTYLWNIIGFAQDMFLLLFSRPPILAASLSASEGRGTAAMTTLLGLAARTGDGHRTSVERSLDPVYGTGSATKYDLTDGSIGRTMPVDELGTRDSKESCFEWTMNLRHVSVR